MRSSNKKSSYLLQTAAKRRRTEKANTKFDDSLFDTVANFAIVTPQGFAAGIAGIGKVASDFGSSIIDAVTDL